MTKQSAGLLLYRWREGIPEFFLVHPGGPFWMKKDVGAWSIPKGEIGANEEPLRAAQREFREETGFEIAGPFRPLGEVRQSGGKVVHAFAAEADLDAAQIKSNLFSLEWPPRSGRRQEFPEVDRAGWFSVEVAKAKLNATQFEFLDRLLSEIHAG